MVSTLRTTLGLLIQRHLAANGGNVVKSFAHIWQRLSERSTRSATFALPGVIPLLRSAARVGRDEVIGAIVDHELAIVFGAVLDGEEPGVGVMD